MEALIPVLLIGVLAIVFAGGLIYATSLIGPKPGHDPIKMMPYECGIKGQDKDDTKISVKFYLTAILFILFDIEIIFMYPWALVFNQFLETAPVFIFVEMMVFVAILIFGLFYVWKSNALEWE